MGLFEKRKVSKEEQQDFAEGGFYQYYERYAGKSPNAREDIWLAELHATYAELQYLRDIQTIVANLRIEVQKLRDEIEQMKR